MIVVEVGGGEGGSAPRKVFAVRGKAAAEIRPMFPGEFTIQELVTTDETGQSVRQTLLPVDRIYIGKFVRENANKELIPCVRESALP